MLQKQSLKAHDFRNESYWWNVAPPDALPTVKLRSSYDAAIVGSGITGLRAAIDLARAGLTVVVFDRDDAGFGAARRNAGFIGRTLKKSYRALQRASGAAYARRVYEELGVCPSNCL
jgi:NADPH-dependent 2,4-dienoyl-CoA reductase/sulfur reductase-like enzyme